MSLREVIISGRRGEGGGSVGEVCPCERLSSPKGGVREEEEEESSKEPLHDQWAKGSAWFLQDLHCYCNVLPLFAGKYLLAILNLMLSGMQSFSAVLIYDATWSSFQKRTSLEKKKKIMRKKC